MAEFSVGSGVCHREWHTSWHTSEVFKLEIEPKQVGALIDAARNVGFGGTHIRFTEAGGAVFVVRDNRTFYLPPEPTDSTFTLPELVAELAAKADAKADRCARDGRDTLTNRAADPSAGGLIFSGTYVCKGFRVSESEVREFVAAQLGHGMTTAERNDTAQCSGLIAAVVYSEGRTTRTASLESFSGPTTRSAGPMRGLESSRGSVGAAAGQAVESRVGSTTWTRGSELWRAIIEYDTREGWAARGINIPGISMANPWPGERRFAPSTSL